MIVFERILDRDDMAGVSPVDLVDERGKRRTLAAPGRAADENESARRLRQLAEDSGSFSCAREEIRVGSTRIDAARRPR